MKPLIATCFILFYARLLLLGTSFAQQCPVGVYAWQLVSGRCLMCYADDGTFVNAKTFCRSRGATLGPILDKATHDFAEGCTPNNSAMSVDGTWTGLRARRNSAGLVERFWNDGTPYTGPPPGVTLKDNGLDVGCYAIAEPNTWVLHLSDNDCDNSRHFMCVRDPSVCQPLDAPTDLAVAYDPSTQPYQPDTVATYSCAEAYVLDRTKTNRVCLSNGTWDGEEPGCNPVDCGPLTAPVNGLVSFATTTFNSVATYSCNSGYTLGDVSPSRTCQANGTWSGTDLTCSSDSNILAISLASAAGALVLLGIIGYFLYQRTRAPQARTSVPRGVFPRPGPNPQPVLGPRLLAGPPRPRALPPQFPRY